MIPPRQRSLLIVRVPAEPATTKSRQNVQNPVAVVAKRPIILWFWMVWKDLRQKENSFGNFGLNK
jgi:hypothetical protein